MENRYKILIENDLYTLVTTLYDSFKEDARDEIKEAIKEFSEKYNLNQAEVLNYLNERTKNRKNFPSKDLTEWYPDKE